MKGSISLPSNPAESVADEETEVKDFLLYTIRLARKKMNSKKLPDTVKVKFLKVGVDASKSLLFSGVLDRRGRREVTSFQAMFIKLRDQRKQSIGNAHTVQNNE